MLSGKGIRRLRDRQGIIVSRMLRTRVGKLEEPNENSQKRSQFFEVEQSAEVYGRTQPWN